MGERLHIGLSKKTAQPVAYVIYTLYENLYCSLLGGKTLKNEMVLVHRKMLEILYILIKVCMSQVG